VKKEKKIAIQALTLHQKLKSEFWGGGKQVATGLSDYHKYLRCHFTDRVGQKTGGGWVSF
jgi:hypothetical protein